LLRKSLSALSLPLALLLIAAMLLKSAAVSDAAFSAMKLSATVVIPTLFPFCVLSGFLVNSGKTDAWGRLLGRPFAALFHLEQSGAAAWILGLLSGCPVGASVITGLVQNGQLRRESAERLLPLCSNPSPAFLVGTAGTMLLGSPAAGWMLLAINWGSSILAGITMRRKSGPDNSFSPARASPGFANAFTDAVRQSAVTAVYISGFIVIFSVLLALVNPLLPAYGSVSASIAGFLEVTNGLYHAAASEHAFVLFAVFLGWSGLCMHFQVLALTLPAGFSSAPYWKGKALQTLYSFVLAIPLSRLLPQRPASPAFRPVPEVSAAAFLTTAAWALFSTAIFFTFLWKNGKLSCIMKKTGSGGRTDAVQG